MIKVERTVPPQIAAASEGVCTRFDLCAGKRISGGVSSIPPFLSRNKIESVVQIDALKLSSLR